MFSTMRGHARDHPKTPERPYQNRRFLAPAWGPMLHAGHPTFGVIQG